MLSLARLVSVDGRFSIFSFVALPNEDLGLCDFTGVVTSGVACTPLGLVLSVEEAVGRANDGTGILFVVKSGAGVIFSSFRND